MAKDEIKSLLYEIFYGYGISEDKSVIMVEEIIGVFENESNIQALDSYVDELETKPEAMQKIANIYDMKLFEQRRILDGNILLRVPGGWIFYYHRLDAGQMAGTFIPYDNEFQEQHLPY